MGSRRVRHDWATFTFSFTWVSLVAKMVKRLPAMQDTQVQSLGWEDPLDKEMATHSSILAWKIPWSEKPDKLQSMGSQRVQHDSQKWLHFCMLFIYVWMSVITYYGKCQKENMYLLLLYKAYIRASLVAQIVKYILLLKLKEIYWSMVDLQCCVSFRCTAKWISYTYKCVYAQSCQTLRPHAP